MSPVCVLRRLTIKLTGAPPALCRSGKTRAGAFRSNAMLGGISRYVLVEEFPAIRSIKVPDDDRLQERWFKIAQVHSMASARLGFERLPMCDDAANLAAHVPQGSIAPDVALRVLGMALDRHRPELVVGPYSSRAPAQRAVATRGLDGRSR
jgi:hypothetical protein